MVPPLDDAARRRRRELARLRARRRRALPGAALAALAALAAAGIVLATSGGGSARPGAAERQKAAPRPAVRQQGAARARGPLEPAGRPLPILMFHATEAPPAGARYPQLWVAPERLRSELAMLRRRGYHGVTMAAAARYLRGQGRLPRRPVVLTFDDGYQSNVSVALPALRRLGWPGTLYLDAAALKTPAPDGIDRAGVRRLLRAGWELGSHTIDHSDLTRLSASRLRYEVAYSRTLLERTFGVRVNSFCYPSGRRDTRVVGAVRRAGYATAVTTDEGLAGAARPLELRRVRVEGTDTAATLAAKLRAAGA